jgi:Uma2 family endonuclease
MSSSTTREDWVMTVMSEQAFQQLALDHPDEKWELCCGQLRQKPGMSYDHNRVGFWLSVQIATQVDRRRFDVRCNAGYVRRPTESYFIPDVIVVPVELTEPLRGGRGLEFYNAPLPLVVEVWSPSTGDYDIEIKLAEYKRRGDLEVWCVHSYERTVTAWRRQPDGSYVGTQFTGGAIALAALPGVTVDLDALFE